MQKLACCIAFIFLSLQANAQKIRFTDTTNEWKVVDGLIGPPPEEYYFKYHFIRDTIINSIVYKILDPVIHGPYIREDSMSQKVYVALNDSTEEVLIDYNLFVGDTVTHYAQGSIGYYDTFIHVVTEIDSTYIDTVAYRVWHLKGIRSTHSGLNAADYNVIEGIGPVKGPLFPLAPFEFENYWVLYCFSNNNITPPINPPVGPYGFDNIKSCTINVSEINKRSKQVTIFPNPANEKTKIIFSNIIQSGSLIIYNQFGQIVFTTNIENKEAYLIGHKISIPGLYFYKLIDNKNAQTFSGKFIYQ